jgi:hypothetical protein
VAGSRGLGSEEPDPRARDDVLWSLKQARVPDAWKLVRAKRAVPPGQEASGVFVAHPDTGFLKHPEIWTANASTSPVWAEKGRDYFGDDDDPTDDLVDGILDFPGHGTGSGSAIVSPEGCQLAGARDCPTGIAAGARLVPLRVHTSVIHFDTRRLTQAILDASGPDRTHVKVETQLMSISMGGVPSWALWKAVRKAEERGFLVIAASGNNVGTVVWPARFDSVISVAATNVGCKPWPHTSMGSRIDVSAPGESVWRATIGDQKQFVTGMGSGTTYATATTAGVAALWIAMHRDSQEFKDLRAQRGVVQAFRKLVRETASRPESAGGTRRDCDPDAPWNAALMGPGIIDAAALVARPLPASSSRSAASTREIVDLPLWASLYGEGAAAERVAADYARLFATDDPGRVGRFEAEVLHHYATDEGVRRAIDRIVAARSGEADSYQQARAALRRVDLSSRLRQALPT